MAAVVASIALLSFVGWWIEAEAVRSLFGVGARMKANTAVALIACAYALFRLADDGGLADTPDVRIAATLRRRAAGDRIDLIALAAAALALAITSLTIAEYAVDGSFSIDEWLVRDDAWRPAGAGQRQVFYAPAPGRMGPYAAMALASVALAQCLLAVRKRRELARRLAAITAFAGAVLILGCAWNVDDRWLPPIPLQTAICLVLVGLGTAACRRRSKTGDRAIALRRGERFGIEARVLAAFAGLACLLVVAGRMSYQSSADFAADADAVDIRQQARVRWSRAVAALANAESSQRAYLLSGDPRFNDDFLAAEVEARAQLGALGELPASPASGRREVDDSADLRRLADERLRLLHAVAATFDRDGLDAARRALLQSGGTSLMDRVRTLGARLDAAAAQQVAAGQDALTRGRRIALVSEFMTLIGTMAILALVFIAIRREMFERSAAQHALAASDAYCRSIIAASPDPLAVLTLEGRIVHMADSALRQAGVRELDAIRGHDWLDLWDAETQPWAIRALDRARSGGERRFVGRLLCGDADARADERSWDVTVAPLVGANGKPERLLCVSHDITPLMRAESHVRSLNAHLESRVAARTAELGYQQAFLRAVIDLNRHVIFAKDLDGRFVLVNRALADVFGTTTEALTGRLCSELELDPKDAAERLRVDRSIIESGREQAREESLVDAAGRERWFSIVRGPIASPNGQTMHLLGVGIDITERKRAEDEVRALNAELEARVAERTRALVASNAQLAQARDAADAASRAKSAFLATMSHEIRTPMNGVVGMVDVLAHGRLSADQADAVHTIRDSAHALLHVIDEILDFSKIESGRLQIERAPVAIGGLAESVRSSLAPLAQSRGVALELSVDPALPASIYGDAVRLRQVLYNLLGNAIKFSADGGRGAVSARVFATADEPTDLCVRVADNGIGMSEETQARLFAPFTQAEASTTRRFGGTGLGLAICKRLVESMDGRIAVSSELGVGSTFEVVLPLQAAPPGDCGLGGRGDASLGPLIVAREAPTFEEARRRGELVLVAEDDAVNRKVIVKQLALLGYAAEVARDGAEALARWRAGGCAAVITDLYMPTLDGYAVARTIRSEEAASKRMPIIALTANALASDDERARAAGIDAYLTKPVQLTRLRDALDAAMGAGPSGALAAGRPIDATASVAPCELDTPSAASPASTVGVVFDASVLEALVGSASEVVDEFLRDYLDALRQCRDALIGACAADEPARVESLAHRFKSTSRAVGALALGDALDAMEAATRTGTAVHRLDRTLDAMAKVERAVVARVGIGLDHGQQISPETVA